MLVVRRQPDWSLAGADPAACWWRSSPRSRSPRRGSSFASAARSPARARCLIAAAAAWLIAEWNNPGAPGAVVFTLGLVLSEASAPLVAHALLVHGHGRLRGRAQLTAVTAAYAGLLVVGGLGATLVSDPGAQGCATCPPNLLRLADAPVARRRPAALGARAGDGGARPRGRAAGTLALASEHGAPALGGARRGRRASPTWPPSWPATFMPGPPGPATTRPNGPCGSSRRCALLGIAAGVGWQRLAARRMRHRLTRIVMQLAQAPRPGELRDLLADALGDPTLELLPCHR